MANSDPTELTLHDLSVADAERGYALSTEIGWNQTQADWQYMLQNGPGVGRTDSQGKLVASAIALPYGRFGWVCMVLVAPDWRRHGIATELMNRVIALLEADGVLPGLDATPDGREVYRRIGFHDIYGIERLVAERSNLTASTPDGIAVKPLDPKDLAAAANYDLPRFGGDRSALLEHLRGRQPDRAVVAWQGGDCRGFALARNGRTWTQIGPVVAENTEIARALISQSAGNGRNLLIDVPADQIETLAWLKAGGFDYQRPYTRMIRGATEPLDQPAAIFALAGPELG